MGFIDSMFSANAKFNVVSSKPLSKEDPQGFKKLDRAYVASRETPWGEDVLEIVLLGKDGIEHSQRLSSESDLEEGDEVDLDSIEIITLVRGDKTIQRLDGELAEETEAEPETPKEKSKK